MAILGNHRSTEKKGIEDKIISLVLEQAGIEVIRNSTLPERLCKPWAAKLRQTFEGMTLFLEQWMWFVAVNTCCELEIKTRECHPSQKKGSPSSLSTPERSPGTKQLQKSFFRISRAKSPQIQGWCHCYSRKVALHQELPAVTESERIKIFF